MLPEEYPLTPRNIGRLLDAAGYRNQEDAGRALGVDQATISKWRGGAIRPSRRALTGLRTLKPLPGQESDWNTFRAEVEAIVAIIKAQAYEPGTRVSEAPTVEPEALAKALAPQLAPHLPKVDTRELAREVVEQMPRMDTGELARQLAAQMPAKPLALPAPTAQLTESAREMADQLAEQAFKVVSSAQEEAGRLTRAGRLIVRAALWTRARGVLRKAQGRAQSLVEEAHRTAQGTIEDAQRTARGIVEDAQNKAGRITRQARWKVGQGGLIAVAVTVGLLTVCNLPWHRLISKEEAARTPTSATKAPAQVSEQLSGRTPPTHVAQAVSVSVFGGLKMPEKPDPTWLQPGKDGKCHNPKTGEVLRPQAVIRGSCWQVLGRLPGEVSCPDNSYDPPSEVLSDSKVLDLHDACFRPYAVTGTTVAPGTPSNSP